MLCPNCGKNIADESKYCLYCGAQIEDNSEPVVVYSARHQRTNANPKTFRKWVIAGVVVLAIVLLAGAGWGAVSWKQAEELRKQKEELRSAIEYEWLAAPSESLLKKMDIDERQMNYSLYSILGTTHVVTYDWEPISKDTIRVWILSDSYQDCTVEFHELDVDGVPCVAMVVKPALTSTDAEELWFRYV